jgi:hypothetical protein
MFGAAQRFLDELTSISDVRVVILLYVGMTTLDATRANALRTVVRTQRAAHHGAVQRDSSLRMNSS